MNEYLRRIDKRDYLTEREHREYLEKLESELEVVEILKKLAKGVINLKENNIDITKYVVLISESTNEKIKQWLEGD